MAGPYAQFSTRRTPQNEPIVGQDQVKNNAGGYVYQLDDFKALERFLVLGSEGGTYYVGEHKLTRENAIRTIKAITADPQKAIQLIVDVSDQGRAPKNDPAIFALALAASSDNKDTRAMALAALPKVCRIPTHLFHFLEYCKGNRGWGRGMRSAIAEWYNSKPIDTLAYQMVKYQSRDGWSNRDALRKAHPKTKEVGRNALYKWATAGIDGGADPKVLPTIIHGFERVKHLDTWAIPDDIRQYNLSREMLPTESLKDPRVWEALLEKMPPEAMIRNLGNMSKVGLLTPLSGASRLIVARLHDEALLKKARIHPINVLIALKTYAQGHGMKGDNRWVVVPNVVNALDDAFYLCFQNIEPTGKRFLFGVDVSGSMSSPCGGTPLSCAEGAAAMALACAKTEAEYYIMGFTAGADQRHGRGHHGGVVHLDGFVDLGITPRMRLDDALRKTRGLSFGATDCALPMIWAEKNKVKADVVVVITDNETWAGSVHPSQALKSYRQTMGIQMKEVVIGMTASDFSIADPNDPLTLDVVGFDTSVPQVIGEFMKGS